MSKTIKQIADELGVTKQAVHQKRKSKALSTALKPFTETVDGVVYISVDGENLIKQAFLKNDRKQNCKQGCKPFTTTVYTSFTPTVDGENTANMGDFENKCKQNRKQECKQFTETVYGSFTPNIDSEIEFLRGQVTHLQAELEKEREHNREKDKQLLDTLNKLAETQSLLAAGTAADKQKALVEKAIEGKQLADEIVDDSVIIENNRQSFFDKIFKKIK